jgi:hypothetical protein
MICATATLYAGTLDQRTEQSPRASAAFGGRLGYGETVNEGPEPKEMKVASQRNN